MLSSLTEEQQIYLNGFRSGNRADSQLYVRNELAQVPYYQADIAFFRSFLADNGNSNPQPRDLALRVRMQTVVTLLQYFEGVGCLGVQTCFGFDRPVANGGQLQLLNKGNFYEGNPVLSDPAIWANIYKTNQRGFILPEMYLNVDHQQPVRVTTARRYLKQFRAYYPERTIRHNPFLHGVTFPIKALLELFTTNADFRQADTLTFRWGLTAYYPGQPKKTGNLSLMVGIDDFSTGPVVEFRTATIAGPALGDCPPKPPC